MNYNITIDDRKYLWVTYLKLQVPSGAAQYLEDFQGFVPRLQSRNSASTLPDWLSRLQVVSSLSPHLSAQESQPLTQYSWNPLWPQDLPWNLLSPQDLLLPPTPQPHQPPRPPQTAGWSGHSSESVAVFKIFSFRLKNNLKLCTAYRPTKCRGPGQTKHERNTQKSWPEGKGHSTSFFKIRQIHSDLSLHRILILDRLKTFDHQLVCPNTLGVHKPSVAFLFVVFMKKKHQRMFPC